MNKYLVSILTVTTVLGGTISPALADDGGGIRDFFRRFRSERQEDRDEREQERQEDRDELASRSQELRLRLQLKQNEERQERLMRFWNKALDRLGHLIDREEAMATRIAARLDKFEAAGKDVSQQEELLTEANLAIKTASDSLVLAREEVQDLVDGDAPIADIIAEVRAQHKLVVGAIRSAHKALVDVIVSTRGMSLTVPSARPSASVNP